MKRLTPFIIIAFVIAALMAPAVFGAPDLAKVDAEAVAIGDALAKANAEVVQLKASRDTLGRAVESIAQVSESKDKTIEWQKGEIEKRDDWLAKANDWKLTLLCLGIGALGLLFLLGGCAGWVLDVGRAAGKCLAVAVPLIAMSAGLAVYGPQYAWIGVGVGLLVSLGGFAWIVHEVRQQQDAAIELADGQQQVENADLLLDPAKAKAILDQARGKLAAKLFKKATS